MFDLATRELQRPDEGKVLPYRPRTSDTAPGRVAAAAITPTAGRADDFQHRMWINLAGLICAVLLTICGVWLASRIADLRQTQDCVLAGRSNCAPIVTVDKQALPLRQH